MATIL